MLQSEYDAIMGRKRLRVFFIILVTIAVAVALYTVIRIGKERFMPSGSKTEMPQNKEDLSSEQGGEQSGTTTAPFVPSRELTPEEISAYENAAKKAEAVQRQSAAGTLSAEEARDQLKKIGNTIPVPPPPPTVKK
jgi:hypothetical protein